MDNVSRPREQRAGYPSNVRQLGEHRCGAATCASVLCPSSAQSLRSHSLHLRETMTRIRVDEAWSVAPSGKRIDVPLDTVRVKVGPFDCTVPVLPQTSTTR
jgi:hypothetical protein